MSLSYEGRKKKILDQLAKEEKVQVPAMAEELNVSAETIRRDLDRLDKEGKLKKVYGGAVKHDSLEPPFEQKSLLNVVEKQEIGRLAASLVKDGDIIMIGSGSTTIGMIPYLSNKKRVTIITHSAAVMRLAMEQFPGRIIFIGGEVNVSQQSVNGPLAEWMLNQLKADKAFFAAGGISLRDGISDYNLNEANIFRKMMERAVETIVLADHTKFGKTTFAHICPLKDISVLISDRGCPDEWIQVLGSQEIELLIADEEEQV
ncbi:DeoR/GlpR family DNA-binding transcription regulator [Paenibacillus mendelii]|uniref:DeoR/GlpR family DNA-binding transcription regulator n=1 Tax=Paenibacillus mendelii TaxID=206163 RepID=A0ABV6JCJ6_9BACL|nr:DeoR/GlpR family DNA-binding transcription regulator [Paenibacillus mendelii]MCQ6562737.1 DeoR/GlpR family DNA-binding transcription regulator [Paenibacillus mendelii]